ncbi:sensor histidine kinase KdpD [uncultured Clostridium sp.]|uniref:sensor histidine kinase n=1 Tax=uncultured Clostridium sp. TaxID=59620 RepID=UPI00265CECFA|nr:HAMP domain-containing sensor histidine kinase [uncultured Clostridium sp.]
MENIIRFKKYEMKSKTYIKYMLSITLVILFLSLNIINFLETKKINNLPIVQDINSINVILGLISIPTCLLYYYMYKNNEFFILKLSYISIFIEYIFVNYIIKDIGLSEYLITFPFVIRIVLLTIAIFNESKYANKIVKNKKISIIIIIIINIIGTYLEIKLNLINILVKRNTIIWYILQGSLLLYYTLLLLKLTKRCIIKNEFIYTIFIGTISIFTIRRLFYFNIFNNVFNNVLVYNSILTFIAYIILIAGLYIEMIRRIELNNILNNQVNNLMGFEKKYNEIKEIEKAKTQFFANLSHEIKTPINIIYSCFQLLDINKRKGETELWNSYNKYYGTIKQNCYRLLRLVNNLVDITKIDSGFMKLNFINYEIVSLVEDITLSIVPYVESKNITVLFDTYVEELVIKCDPESLERVILNLLSNAVKFSNENGNITVLLDANKDFVIIKVKDDGIGIAPEVSDYVFERFAQEDKSFNRKKEGSGIGLSLVKSLVELHGGVVYLEKSVEQGCEFVIKLPNKILDESKNEEIKSIDIDNKPLIQKVNIEFSDIYELY